MGITHQGNHGNLLQPVVNGNQDHRIRVSDPSLICGIQTDQHNIVYITIRCDRLCGCILCHVLLCFQQFRIGFFLFLHFLCFFFCRFFLLLFFFLFFNHRLNFFVRHIVGFCIVPVTNVIYHARNDCNQHQKNPDNDRRFLFFRHLRLLFLRRFFLLFIVC